MPKGSLNHDEGCPDRPPRPTMRSMMMVGVLFLPFSSSFLPLSGPFLMRRSRLDLKGDRLRERCDFSGDCYSDDVGRLAGGLQTSIARAQTKLRFPGDGLDLFRKFTTAVQHCSRHARR